MYKLKKYTAIGMGGTFDHLHQGHKDFILFASSLAKKIYIGVTEEKLTRGKKHQETIQPYRTRMKNVLAFCKKNNIICSVIPLHDAFGPTIEKNDIQALAVTTATEPGGKEINIIRKKLKLQPLPIHVCNLTKGSDNQVINSTRVRSGEITRDGFPYASLFAKDYFLSNQARDFFSQKQGELISKPSLAYAYQKRIVVGDTSLDTFKKNQWQYDLGVFDNHAQRDELVPVVSTFDAKVANPAGSITVNLVNTLLSWKHVPFEHLFVEGEEDLATVAAVLTMPLGTMIYYGQPNQGLIEVEVTEEVKERFFKALIN